MPKIVRTHSPGSAQGHSKVTTLHCPSLLLPFLFISSNHCIDKRQKHSVDANLKELDLWSQQNFRLIERWYGVRSYGPNHPCRGVSIGARRKSSSRIYILRPSIIQTKSPYIIVNGIENVLTHLVNAVKPTNVLDWGLREHPLVKNVQSRRHLPHPKMLRRFG